MGFPACYCRGLFLVVVERVPAAAVVLLPAVVQKGDFAVSGVLLSAAVHVLRTDFHGYPGYRRSWSYAGLKPVISALQGVLRPGRWAWLLLCRGGS